MDDDISAADARKVTEYCNTVEVASALEWLEAEGCFAELAWLSHCKEVLERQWVVEIMTAYAHGRGELDSIVLSLPEEMES